MINEDLSVYFRTDDFGEELQIGTGTYTGIWDEPYVEDLNTEQARPNFTTGDDVSAVRHGDQTTRNTRTYSVVEVRPDGSGVTMIFFHED